MNIQEIKKVELHNHVDGLLNPAIMNRLPSDIEFYKLIPNLEEFCPVKDYKDWIERYNTFVVPVFENKGEWLLQILLQYLETLKQQNVIYSEIMLSSFTFQYSDIVKQIELYEKYRHLANKVGGDDLQIEFLIAIGRTNDRRKMECISERILEIAKAGLICGVAVAGIEEENTIKLYQGIFAKFQQTGLGIEIHAGEWSGPDYIWEALEYGYASRIGHGLSAFDDPLLVKYIKTNNIHLEFSPTSNMLLTKYKDITEHPIKRALKEEISFSINTDDPGPFATDINREYAIVQKAFNLTKDDFDKILKNSLNASFGSLNNGTRGYFNQI